LDLTDITIQSARFTQLAISRTSNLNNNSEFATLQIRQHIQSVEIPDVEITSVDCMTHQVSTHNYIMDIFYKAKQHRITKSLEHSKYYVIVSNPSTFRQSQNMNT